MRLELTWEIGEKHAIQVNLTAGNSNSLLSRPNWHCYSDSVSLCHRRMQWPVAVPVWLTVWLVTHELHCQCHSHTGHDVSVWHSLSEWHCQCQSPVVTGNAAVSAPPFLACGYHWMPVVSAPFLFGPFPVRPLTRSASYPFGPLAYITISHQVRGVVGDMACWPVRPPPTIRYLPSPVSSQVR